MWWWIVAVVIWITSAMAILATLYEVGSGKKKIFDNENIAAYGFHGITAVLALWLFFKALS